MDGICTCTFQLARLHARTRTHTRTHAHTRTHTHTHIHTHTHTHTHKAPSDEEDELSQGAAAVKRDGRRQDPTCHSKDQRLRPELSNFTLEISALYFKEQDQNQRSTICFRTYLCTVKFVTCIKAPQFNLE